MKKILALTSVFLYFAVSGSLLALQVSSTLDANPPDIQAWNKMSSSVNPQVRSDLALQFLETYPDSDLIYSVHHLLGLYYLGIDDQEKFILHGEKALEGLPELPDMLIHLSFVYAEGDQPAKAVKKAVKALQVIKNLPDPNDDSAIEWYSQLERLEAEANYSLGRAYLTYADQDPEKKEMNLTRSIGYFQNALQHDPRHAFASFRLGHAYRNLNLASGAVNAYARTVAIGGRTSEPARQELSRLLGIIKEAAPESAWKDRTVEGVLHDAEAELIEAEKLNRDTVAEKASRLTAFGS